MQVGKERLDKIVKELDRMSSIGLLNKRISNHFKLMLFLCKDDHRLRIVIEEEPAYNKITFTNFYIDFWPIPFDKFFDSLPYHLKKEFIFNMDIWT